MAKFLSFISGTTSMSATGHQDTFINETSAEGFEDLESKIPLDLDKLKFIKKVFFNENFYTANVYEIDDIKSKIKTMVNTNKLPRFNT